MKKKIIKIAATGFIFVLIVIILCNILVSSSTKNSVYDNPQNIPYKKVGLLLGTSKYLKNGRINEYWKNRIDATVELYKLKKIKFVITATISGFHSSLLWLKPLNPILGETFETYYEDGSHVYLEQTSHHPPISHFLVYGPNNNYKIYGYSNFTSSAGLNSLKVIKFLIFTMLTGLQ
jgi:hypothetical protein